MVKMNNFHISEFFLYRWRFWIGYGLIAIGLIAVLILAGIYLPGGISNQEMQSIVKSSSLGFTSLTATDITNLPYHLLQHAIITIFGVSIFTIKLPSLILAFLSAVGIVLILKRWFKPGIGVLASLVAITTGQFLFIAQDGTPNILYLFWPVCLLLLASIISYQKKFRLFFVMALFITAALSLYTPLSIYLLLAFGFVVLLHPHLRFLVRQITKTQLITGLILAVIVTAPLAIAIFKNPSLGLTLFGIPTDWPNFGANFTSLGAQYFGFSRPGGLTLMTPFFELGSMIIIAIGIYHVVKTSFTAKNYVIMSWLLCLIPLIILNPNLTSITFLPLVLLLATGLNALLSYWYGLFPNNPYARIGGLVPIVILVTVLVFSGTSRFIYGYTYDPNIVSNFSKDLNIVPSDTKNLIVSDGELPFYKDVEFHNKKYNVSTLPTGNSFLATRKSHQAFTGYKISRIITSGTNGDSDRFYLYTKIVR